MFKYEVKLVTHKVREREEFSAFDNAEQVYDFSKKVLKNYNKPSEEMWAIYVNNARECLGASIIGKGGLTSAPMPIRDIIRYGLYSNAAAVILVHNHPSGNTTPSATDIESTKRVKQACELMELCLLDHVIVSTEGYYSLKEGGRI